MSIFETFLNWKVFIQTLPLLLSGLTTTLTLGITAIILGFIGGLVLALVRLYGTSPFRQLAIAYIDVFRSIPIWCSSSSSIMRFPSWASGSHHLAQRLPRSASCRRLILPRFFGAGIEAVPERPVRGRACGRS